MLVSEALTLIQGHGGFDPSVAQTSDTQRRAWLSTQVQSACARAKWLRQRRLLGPTVAGTSDYIVDADVIQVKSIRVGASRRWGRVTLEQTWDVEAGESAIAPGVPGIFAPLWEEEAAQDVEDVPREIRLMPTPTTAGLKLEAVCVVGHKPITDVTSGSYSLQVPGDLAYDICVRGAIGLGIQLVHERMDLAAPHLAAYTDAVAQLKKRAESLVGQGVTYPPIAGRR